MKFVLFMSERRWQPSAMPQKQQMWLQISCHKFNGVQEVESMHAYMSINLARLDEGRGIATTSLCHNKVVYHKACYLKFAIEKLKRTLSIS